MDVVLYHIRDKIHDLIKELKRFNDREEAKQVNLSQITNKHDNNCLSLISSFPGPPYRCSCSKH